MRRMVRHSRSAMSVHASATTPGHSETNVGQPFGTLQNPRRFALITQFPSASHLVLEMLGQSWMLWWTSWRDLALLQRNGLTTSFSLMRRSRTLSDSNQSSNVPG